MTPGMRQQVRDLVDRERRLRNLTVGTGSVDIAAPADLEPILARLAGQYADESTIDVEAHLLAVARVVIAAKRKPCNPYAEATL